MRNLDRSCVQLFRSFAEKFRYHTRDTRMYARYSERTESIGRYEGMDLDLKGGRTRRQGRLGGLEVGRAISEPSVAQWLTGAIQPTGCLYLRRFWPRHRFHLQSHRHMPYSAAKVPARVTLN